MADEKMEEDASSQIGDLANFSNLHVDGRGDIDDNCSVKSEVTIESATVPNRSLEEILYPNRYNTNNTPQPSTTTSAHTATQLFANAPRPSALANEAQLRLEVELLVQEQNNKYLSAIQSNKDELERLSKVVKTQQDLLEKSEKRDNKSTELIKSYHKDLLDTLELVGRLLQEIESHEKISKTLKEALDEKNDAISVKCLEIASLHEQCDELIAFRTNNEAQIESVKSKLSKFATQILCLQEGFTSLTSEKEADANRLRTELEEAKQKDSRFQKELDFLENAKQIAEARTKSLEAEVLSKQTSNNIDGLEQELVTNEAHIRYLESVVDDKNDTIELLKAELSVEDATIQRMEVEATQMSEVMESLEEELSKEKIINQSQRMELDRHLRIDDYEDDFSVATGRSVNTSMSVDTRMSGEDEREPSRGRSRQRSVSPTRREQTSSPDPDSRKANSRKAELTLGLSPASETRRARSRSSGRTKTTYKLRDDSGDAKTDVVISDMLAFSIFDAMVVFETKAGDYLPKVSTSLLGLARMFVHYRPLILGSDNNKKVNHFLKATEEMASLLGDRPPTVVEIRVVYELLKLSVTTRDDYNNGKKGCKVLVEAFLYSLKQVTPKTLHFIILLMHCPKDKFNAEGLFCDPTTGSEECDTLHALKEISNLMIERDVYHLSCNNFEVFNGSRSNCIRETSYSKDLKKKYKHCATCSDDEAVRRGGLLNSFGAFLRFCGVPTLLISFAGDGIDKLKDQIRPELFSHYAGLRSTHACNFLNFCPRLKTVEKHLSSGYERTLPSCNTYESFLRDVSDRADKLGISFPMLPDKPLIDRMANSEQLPLFGNKFNSVHLELANDKRNCSKVYVGRYDGVIVFYSPDGLGEMRKMLRKEGATFGDNSFPTQTELKKGQGNEIVELTIEIYASSSVEATEFKDTMEPGPQDSDKFKEWKDKIMTKAEFVVHSVKPGTNMVANWYDTSITGLKQLTNGKNDVVKKSGIKMSSGQLLQKVNEDLGKVGLRFGYNLRGSHTPSWDNVGEAKDSIKERKSILMWINVEKGTPGATPKTGRGIKPNTLFHMPFILSGVQLDPGHKAYVVLDKDGNVEYDESDES